MRSMGKHKPIIGLQQGPLVKRRQGKSPLAGRAKLERELDLLARLPSTSRYARCVRSHCNHILKGYTAPALDATRSLSAGTEHQWCARLSSSWTMTGECCGQSLISSADTPL